MTMMLIYDKMVLMLILQQIITVSSSLQPCSQLPADRRLHKHDISHASTTVYKQEFSHVLCLEKG